MAISLKSTNTVHSDGLKIVVHGASGAGKTTLIRTLPNPVIISAEGGLLSLSDSDIPYMDISSMTDLQDAFKWCESSKEAEHFESIALDSISEVAEVVLAHEKRVNKDGRAAYGELQVQMTSIIRAFRDLKGKHVYFSAKTEKSVDETGRMLHQPSMPGTKLSQQLPYFVDFVFALRAEKDEEGHIQRGLMTQPDGSWTAKSRSDGLDAWEPADLALIINKIVGRPAQ
jgi:phage nucleotide-binding protein